jgi:hypothetical protein
MPPPLPDFIRKLAGVEAVPGVDATLDVDVDGTAVRVVFTRHPRAVRYRLTLCRDGTARCTVPRRGSLAEAHRFVARSHGWLVQRIRIEASRPKPQREWRIGTPVWFRGERPALELAPGGGRLRLGDTEFPLPRVAADDLRPHVERRLRMLAAVELPLRVRELAAVHGLAYRSVSVRNQRSRWGSCSARHGISLNWRLVQTPVSVRDYIVLHELAHTRHLDHSDRFWAEVARMCPTHAQAELWLRTRGEELIG